MNEPRTGPLLEKSVGRSLTKRVLTLSLIALLGLVSAIGLGFWMTLYRVQVRMDRINDEAVSVFDRFLQDIKSDLSATSDGLASREDRGQALLSLLDNVATSQISHEGGGLSEFEGRGRERLAVHDAARAISGVVRIGAAGGARALSAKRGVSTLRQS